MKKIYSILVIAVVIASLLTGCGAKADYYYADKWPTANITAVEHYPDYGAVEFDYLNEMLDICIASILCTLSQDKFDYFNWDRLDTVQIKYSVQDSMSDDAEAWYNDEQNIVYVTDTGMDCTSDVLVPIVIHELMHALTCSEATRQNSMMYEGVADFFTAQIANALELPYEIYYIREVGCFLWLSMIYDADEVIKMFYDGTLNDTINKTLGRPGMGEKLSAALAVVHDCDNGNSQYQSEREEALLAEFDILCHLAKTSDSFDVEQGKMILQEFGIKDTYFGNLLEGGDS